MEFNERLLKEVYLQLLEDVQGIFRDHGRVLASFFIKLNIIYFVTDNFVKSKEVMLIRKEGMSECQSNINYDTEK